MSETFSVADKVVVITGAGQGIGRSFAKAFASAGARVVIAERNVEKARAVEQEIASGNGQALVVETDVADEGSINGLAAAIDQAFGRADVLINNAAIFSTLEMRPFDQIPVPEWEQVLRVNVTGPFLCARAMLPLDAEKQMGTHHQHGVGSGHARTAELSALHRLEGSARRHDAFDGARARPDGSTVNAILPGATYTEIARKTVTPEQKQRIVAMQSIPRPQVPDDLIGVVMFLASDASAFMTGQELTVDGGATHP